MKILNRKCRGRLSDSLTAIRKMRKKSVSLLFILLCITSGRQYAQCGGYITPPTVQSFGPTCSNNSSAYQNKYSQQSFYQPTYNDPVITIKLTYHVFYYGNSGFQPTGPTVSQMQFITNGIWPDSFERYSFRRTANYMPNFTPPFTPVPGGGVDPHIPNGDQNLMDSRVRYEVTNVYYYNNQSMYNSNSGQAIINHINSVNPNRIDEGLPIIFNGAVFPGYTGYASGYNGKPFVHTSAGPGSPWWITQHLRHEIGHCVGWQHTYNSELNSNPCTSPDFLSDVFPLANPNCPNNPQQCNTCYEDNTYYSNNVMCANPISLGNEWISPLQMGRRIRNLHLPWNGLRFYAKDTKSQSTNPWLITSNETWDFDIQMYRDILVKVGNTLKITCNVAMATDGKIIVEKGAKLIIDGGTVTGWCKKTPQGSNFNCPLWTGIEVDGSPNQNQLINNITGLCPNQGIVEIKNGGTISYAMKGINTSLTNSTGQWQSNTSGGVVIGDNGNFINNQFDIIFYKYMLGNGRCKLTNCTFKTTGEIGRYSNNMLIKPLEHVKLYQHFGLNILGCKFEYAAGNTYTNSDKGIGLYTTDSQFNVDRFCPNLSCTGAVRTKFNYLWAGAYVDNFNPQYTGTIKYSDFVDNNTGAILENVNYMNFLENNISMTNNNVGVYAYKAKYYNICNNTFSGLYKQGVGVVTLDSKIGAHQVYHNTFTALQVGIMPEDNNGGAGINDLGLRMNCNIFNSGSRNMFDIAVVSQNIINPTVMKLQGALNPVNGTQYVRNLYGASYMNSTTPTKFYIDPTCTQQIIHPSKGITDNPNLPLIQASPQLLIVSGNPPFNYATDCLPYPSSSGGTGTSNTQRIANLNEYIQMLRPETEDIAKYEIQASVSSKLGIFLCDSVAEDKDSVMAICNNNQGGMDDADIQNIFTSMRYADYESANAQILALPTERSDWAGLLNKLVEIEQRPLGIYSLLEDSTSVIFIKDYANTEGKNGQATAQSILRFVFGIEHTYPVIYPVMIDGRTVAPANIVNQASSDMGILLYPNPAQTGVTIINMDNKENEKIEIKDLLGKLVYSEMMGKENKHYISLSEFANGVYMITVLKNEKEIVYKNKLVIQQQN